jgi:hypothetical protein
MRRIALLLAFVIVVLMAATASAATERVRAPLKPVGDSGVTGKVKLVQMPKGGTNIHIVARGLTPGVEYLSLYYENHTCELELYEEDDVIGTYTADDEGVGTAHRKVGDDLDEINSVSVRLASDFSLLACADIHPAP